VGDIIALLPSELVRIESVRIWWHNIPYLRPGCIKPAVAWGSLDSSLIRSPVHSSHDLLTFHFSCLVAFKSLAPIFPPPYCFCGLGEPLASFFQTTICVVHNWPELYYDTQKTTYLLNRWASINWALQFANLIAQFRPFPLILPRLWPHIQDQ